MTGKQKSGLRIAIFGQKHIPSNEGGIEVVVEQLAVRMAAKGHSVTCYNRSADNVAGKEFNGEKLTSYKGVRLKEVFTIDRRGLAAISSALSAAVRTALGRYDVVHIHAEGPAIFCWLPKLMGKKVFVTVHGLDHQRAKWGKLASHLILCGEKAAVRHADEIIVLSENVGQYFSDTYGRQTCFIPNGVSPMKKRPADIITEQWGLAKDDYILFLGRIVPEKGLRLLIRAFRQVKTDKKLVIAGGSSDTQAFFDELREMAQGDDRILFTGFVQGKAKRELYSNAYFYVLPSDLEGMPLSLMEAMAYGNCCLTSDIPECTSVCEDHGLSFLKGDPGALTEAIQKLCDHPEVVEAYRQGAEEFILSEYNWDDVAERTLELYQK